VLLRKLADQCGLTAALEAALAQAGKPPQFSRGVALVSMAVAIALGATSMSDVAVLAHLAPVLGAAPCGSTVRSTLGLADARTLGEDRAGQSEGPGARVDADREDARLLPVAGDRREGAGGLAGDRNGRDAGHRALRQRGCGSHVEEGLQVHPLGAWLANTCECLAMLLRPGNAGPDTFSGHKEVLTAALRQVPARMRGKILVRVDGAGASHELVRHLLSLASPRRKVLFTCGWMITPASVISSPFGISPGDEGFLRRRHVANVRFWGRLRTQERSDKGIDAGHVGDIASGAS